MDAVQCFIGKSQDQWDIRLHQIAGALRASVNRQTWFTANKLMLGRELNTPAYLMFPQVCERKDNVEGFVALAESVQKAHEVAPSNLKTATKRMKRNYDLQILQRTDAVKAPVYIFDKKASVKGECKKLGIVWKGPGNKIARIPLQSEASECTYGSKPRYDQRIIDTCCG